MSTNLDRYKADLDKLVKLGETTHNDLIIRSTEREGQLNEMLKELRKRVSGSFDKNINVGTPKHTLSSVK